MNPCLLSSRSWVAMMISMSGWAVLSARLPSGADRSPTKVIFLAFFFLSSFTVAMADPPVASMGSRMMTSALSSSCGAFK